MLHYRTIIFVDSEANARGYPMPHLLGQRLICGGHDPGVAQQPQLDTILLDFSCGTVEVTGTNLAALWEKLVRREMDSPAATHITVRVGESDAKCGEKNSKFRVSRISFA
jgi:hypothetical protein